MLRIASPCNLLPLTGLMLNISQRLWVSVPPHMSVGETANDQSILWTC